MTTDLFRELVSIARDYLHPFQAESFVHSWCEKCGVIDDNVTIEHLPSIVLIIATDNTLYQKLKFHQYLNMMKRFIAFSNNFETCNPDDTREFLREKKGEKKKKEEICYQ
jgi:hypothetical protein